MAGNKPTDLETRVRDEVSGGFGSRTRRLKRFCGRSTGRNHTVASLGHVQYAGIEEGFGAHASERQIEMPAFRSGSERDATSTGE